MAVISEDKRNNGITAVISENKRNNGNNCSSGIKDGAQRTLQQPLLWELKSMVKHLVENSLKSLQTRILMWKRGNLVPKQPPNWKQVNR